jgi:hypothetical protein
MKRLQAKEETVVRKEVIAVLYNRLKKSQIPIDDTLSYNMLRSVIQSTGYSKYLKHVVQIRWRLTGIRPKRFTEEEAKRILVIFNEIQEPYEKFKGHRINFMNYSYTLYKICQLLGLNEFLPALKKMKFDKIMDLDIIWAKICKEKGYDFIRTT